MPMKVTVNSTQKTFQVLTYLTLQAAYLTWINYVEVEPGQTVGDLKNEINKSEGFPADRQKLVVSGW